MAQVKYRKSREIPQGVTLLAVISPGDPERWRKGEGFAAEGKYIMESTGVGNQTTTDTDSTTPLLATISLLQPTFKLLPGYVFNTQRIANDN